MITTDKINADRIKDIKSNSEIDLKSIIDIGKNYHSDINNLTSKINQIENKNNNNIVFASGIVRITRRRSAVGGWFSWSYNYGIIRPPKGFSMSNLKAFIPSINRVYYAGNVNSDDVTWCTWRKESSYIRVVIYNIENRADSYFNYLAIWQK